MHRILIVDDDPSNLELARKILHGHGYEVIAAREGHEAVQLAVESHLDAIIMDLSLPGMDGWQAIREIRDRLGASVPILAVTAHAMAGDREQALAAGCTDYLAKPYRPAELRARVDAVVAAPLDPTAPR